MKKQYLSFSLSLNTIFGIIVVITLAGIGVSLFSLWQSQQLLHQSPITKNAGENKLSSFNFQSSNLHFSVQVPGNYQVEEKQTYVLLKNNKGNISISRIATNFNNTDDYLNDLSAKNKIQLQNREIATINSYSSISGIIYDTTGLSRKNYFMYVNGWVYTTSTEAAELFDDLDRITQSFQYIP